MAAGFCDRVRYLGCGPSSRLIGGVLEGPLLESVGEKRKRLCGW